MGHTCSLLQEVSVKYLWLMLDYVVSYFHFYLFTLVVCSEIYKQLSTILREIPITGRCSDGIPAYFIWLSPIEYDDLIEIKT
jgi:hypothetical protein